MSLFTFRKMHPSFYLINSLVLRLLALCSNIILTSRHITFRQSFSLCLSSSKPCVGPIPEVSRLAVGTTISVKEIFSNHPVRQATCRSNSHVEWTEVKKIAVGIGLSYPIAVTVRNQIGEKVVRIERREGREWETWVLERGLVGKFCLFKEIEERLDDVVIKMKIFFGSIIKGYTFTCKFPTHC